MKYFKKIFVAIIIVAMCGQSFAAVVSDNDGSAFITKSEFDSLKDNFQKQVDNYNSSIDSKIDGAIASYLSGLQISLSTTYNNVSGFNKYYFINKTLTPTFIVPSWHVIINYCGDSRLSDSDTKSFHVNAVSEYNQPINATCKRPIFGILSGDEDIGFTDYFWRGVALAYNESFQTVQTRYFHAPNLGWTAGYSYRVNFEGLHAIIAPDGFTSDLNSDAVYNPVMHSEEHAAGVSSWSRGGLQPTNYLNNYISIKTLVTLGTIGGKQTEYDHIGCYKGETMFALSNETLLHTFRTHTLNTLKDSNIRSVVKDEVKGGFLGSVGRNGNRTAISSLAYTDKNITLKSIGMLKDDVAAKNIKQFSGDFVYSAKKSITVPNCSLKDGFILAYGNEGDTIDWDVDILNVTINNGSTDVVNSNEVDIYVSYVPFSDTISSADLVKLGTLTDYVTTIGRRAHLTWTANKDSLFYVKMVPHFSGTSYIDNPWEIELNLNGSSGEYIVTAEI